MIPHRARHKDDVHHAVLRRPFWISVIGAVVVLKDLGTLVLRTQQPEDALGTGVFTDLSFRTDRLMRAAGPKRP